uniref:Uncharacterized protein n=1 Tax=Rhizophora mucronata TaxID=61149 RepID=A0A2P2QS93_RHIMU
MKWDFERTTHYGFSALLVVILLSLVWQMWAETFCRQ